MRNQKDNKNVSRRSYLAGGAAIAAGSILPGCGGGDTETELDQQINLAENIDSEVQVARAETTKAASTTALIDLNTNTQEWYYIEIAYKGSRNASVLLSVEPGLNYTIGERRTDTGTAHCIQHALLDTAPSSRENTLANRTKLLNYAALRISIGNGTQSGATFWAGKGIESGPRAQRYYYSDHQETEWLFAYSGTASPTNWDVAVRFFRAPSSEVNGQWTAYISNIALSEPNHDHNKGKTVVYPKFYPNLPNEPTTHAAGIIANSSTGEDTLVIPNHRHPSHFELIKPLGHKFNNSISRKLHARRIIRHMERFGSHIRSESAATTANLGGKASRVHNELMKVLCGGSIGEKITGALTDSVTKIKNSTNFSVNSAIEKLCQYADNLDTENNKADIQRALNQAPKQKSKGTEGVGASAGVSLQVKAQGNFVIPFIDVPSHAAIRTSLLISKASWAALSTDGEDFEKTSTYRLSERGKSGYKLTITGILGPDVFPTKTLQFDVEVNLAMSIERDTTGKYHCRIDAIVLDPVLDLNMRSWTTEIMEKAMGKVLGSVPRLSNITALKDLTTEMVENASSTTWTGIANELDPGLSGGALLPGAVAVLEDVALAALTKAGRTWSLQEYSPARFCFFNSDSFDTYTGDFRGGFKGSLAVGYMPGVKVLAGTGFEVKTSNVEGVFRVLAGTEINFMFGSRGVQGAALQSNITSGA
ncbi:hypothetical protein [Acidovorax sp. RAC01]|uniref:hypothetical protein n=1 Tax=Acidovorax sp. RAC01 TaxID=1842533 RepID=UPI0008559970|nr:hypothetical protein [Acidovorax sp. RAC01]AOG24693.1 putative lipoprotein [Acidovorax sp. RAC01]